MKKFVIILMLLTGGFGAQEFSNTAEAQVRKERRIVKAKKRTVKRRVRRNVVRRVTRRAHLSYLHLPRYRTRVVAVPAGAIVIKRSGNVVYHYHNGVFYQPKASAYVVVSPAVGVRVKTLPAGRKRIVVANKPYFYYYGTFYKETKAGYEVVQAPSGALVNALPNGYEVEEVNNQQYYVLDGVRYQEVETDELENGVGYEVVKVG